MLRFPVDRGAIDLGDTRPRCFSNRTIASMRSGMKLDAA
jgi:hypothetical protein